MLSFLRELCKFVYLCLCMFAFVGTKQESLTPRGHICSKKKNSAVVQNMIQAYEWVYHSYDRP